MKKLVTRLGLLAAVLLQPAPCAQAASFLEMTGSMGSRNPFSTAVRGGDASVAYFNPALLTRLTPGLSLSVGYLGRMVDIGYAPRPDGTDVAGAIYDARRLLPDGTTQRLEYRPMATGDLRQARGSAAPGGHTGYVGVGAVSHFWDGRIALGLYAVLPLSDFQALNTSFPDAREQAFSNSLQFELQGDRIGSNVIALGLGGRLWPWLHLGAGVTMSTSAVVTSSIYVGDASYQESADINAQQSIDVRFTPHFSVVGEPVPGLLVSGSLHLPFDSAAAGRSDVQMWNYPYEEGKNSLVQEFEFVGGFEPLRTTLGVSWQQDAGRVRWNLSGQARYARWSQYRNRHSERPRDAWSDTVSGFLGGGVGSGAHDVGLDVGFVPTPVPDQVGMDNYVDNHRLVGALGWQWRLPVAQGRYEVGLNAQVHYLVPRTVVKDLTVEDAVFDEFPDSVDVKTGEFIAASQGFQTNNPGYPGFDSSGWLVGGSLFFRTSF